MSQGRPLLELWVSEVFNFDEDDNTEDKPHTVGVRKPQQQWNQTPKSTEE